MWSILLYKRMHNRYRPYIADDENGVTLFKKQLSRLLFLHTTQVGLLHPRTSDKKTAISPPKEAPTSDDL